MDKLTSLFRVFDVAFFAPGTVILLALWRKGHLSSVDFKTSLSTVEGLMSSVILVTLAYVIGLLCHGLQRIIYKITRWLVSMVPKTRPESRPRNSWYRQLQTTSRAELAHYFWYMRSTCWNLALAAIVSAYLVGHSSTNSSGQNPKLLIPVAVLVAVLVFSGIEFDGAMRRAATKVETENPAQNNTSQT